MKISSATTITLCLLGRLALSLPTNSSSSDESSVLDDHILPEDSISPADLEFFDNSTTIPYPDYVQDDTSIEHFNQVGNKTYAEGSSPFTHATTLLRDQKGNNHGPPYDLEVLQKLPTLTKDQKEALADAFDKTQTSSIPQLLAAMKTGKVPQYVLTDLDKTYEKLSGQRPSCRVWSDHVLWRWRQFCDRNHILRHGDDDCWNRAPTFARCCDSEWGFKKWKTAVCHKHKGGGWPPQDGGYDLRMCSKFCPMRQPGDCMIWHPKIKNLKMNDEVCLCKFRRCPGYPHGNICTRPGCV